MKQILFLCLVLLCSRALALPCTGNQEFRATAIGTFSSNDNGTQYQPNSNCDWIIYATSPQTTTVISFSAFNLANDDTLSFFYDAMFTNAGPTMTGNQLPAQVVAPKGADVSVNFFSNEVNEASGFTANFEIHYCYGTVDLAGASGTFDDGSANANYDHYANCAWKIAGVPNQRAILTFSAFDTEANTDFVTIYDGPDQSSPLLGSFSGNQIPQQIIGSVGKDMFVRFYSDADINGAGWTAAYTHNNVGIVGTTGGVPSTQATTGVSNAGFCTITNPAGCRCPDGSQECDLLPDMTSSADIISRQHYETPGRLTLSNATPNIGWGPLEVHAKNPPECYCGNTIISCTTTLCPDGTNIKEAVEQTIYHKRGNTMTTTTRTAGTMSYHPSHGHVHIDGWADLSLRNASSDPDPRNWPVVGRSSKVSFCLVNLGDCSSDVGYCRDNSNRILTQADIPNAGFGTVTGCGRDQGIFTGYLDIYEYALPDMFITIPPGTCNGLYYVVSVTDPNNVMLEQDKSNNWVAVPIYLTQQTDCGNTTLPPVENNTNAECTLYSSFDLPQRIPPGDATAGTTISNITVTDSFEVTRVSVMNVIGVHTYLGDLDFFLVGPDNTQVQLVQRRCGATSGFSFSFEDRALGSNWPCPPMGGAWRPDFPLSVFNGKNSAGVWRLVVIDQSLGDFGELQGWHLELCKASTQTGTQSGTQTNTETRTASETGVQTTSTSTTQPTDRTGTRTTQTGTNTRTQETHAATTGRIEVVSTSESDLKSDSVQMRSVGMAIFGILISALFFQYRRAH